MSRCCRGPSYPTDTRDRVTKSAESKRAALHFPRSRRRRYVWQLPHGVCQTNSKQHPRVLKYFVFQVLKRAELFRMQEAAPGSLLSVLSCAYHIQLLCSSMFKGFLSDTKSFSDAKIDLDRLPCYGSSLLRRKLFGQLG